MEEVARAIMAETEEERATAIDAASVRYFVQQAMFCPQCGNIMDMRRAAIVEVDGKFASGGCTPCLDDTVEKLRGRHGEEVTSRMRVARYA